MDHAQRTQDSYDRVAAQYLEGSRSFHPASVDASVTELLPSNPLVLDLGKLVRGWDQRNSLARPACDFGSTEAGVALIAAHQEIPASRPGGHASAGRADRTASPESGPVHLCCIWSATNWSRRFPEFATFWSRASALRVAQLRQRRDLGHSKFGPEAPRWFTYWSDDDLDASLGSAGFEIVESATEEGLRHKWIARIARRNG